MRASKQDRGGSIAQGSFAFHSLRSRDGRRSDSAILGRLLLALTTALPALGMASMAAQAAAPTLLETGQGAALQRVTLPLTIPTNFASASLRFDFSFGTDEQIVPGEFLDSLTISLRTTNRAHVATVLTVDRFGVTWAPDGPAGVLNPDEDIQFEPASAHPASIQFLARAAYRVVIEIPAPFLQNPSVVVVSLFDNGNPDNSRAILNDLRVRPGTTTLLALESSASPAGPFAREPSAVVNLLQQTLTVRKTGAHRYFRLRGDTNSTITRLGFSGQQMVLNYDADLGQLNLRLEGANNPAGPFRPVNNAAFDLSARKVFIPLLNAPGFFQIVGSHPARIINDEVSGEQRILGFDVAPKVPALESSSQPGGPFAEEMGVTADAFARRLTLPHGGAARFFRIASESPQVIQDISPAGDNLVLRYEDP